ncbi:MAG: ABC transporter ATP-binding protein [Clostridia bacterium]|nr:ABC transporter ATP-binding protein [Clostridia bacterium]
MKLFKNFEKNKALLSRFMPYLKAERKTLAFDLFCASLTTVCEIVLPLIVREVTNASIETVGTLTVSLIVKVVLLYIVLRVVDSLAAYYMATYGHYMGTKIETAMRNDLFAHLQKLSFSYYDNNKIGQLMSRLTSDLFDVTEFAHHMPEEVFITSIKIIACFSIFASMNLWLAVIVFAFMPIMFAVTKRNRVKMKEAFKESRHRIGEINAQTENSLLGIRVVKSFVKEDSEMKKFTDNSGLYHKIKRDSYKFMGRFQTTIRLFDGGMYILCVATGAVFMMKGLTTPGDFTASLMMVTTLVGSVRRLIDFSEQFNRGLTGIERFAEVMDVSGEPGSDGEGKVLDSFNGEIEFCDVSFKYEGTDKYVFRDLNLKIEKGKSVAIVGPSGAGKTTICNMIPRFYHCDEGKIFLDGHDINDLSLSSLRKAIGIVQQDVYLFSGTIRDNICYGKESATDEEIVEAAKRAGAHDFIMSLSDGYDTYIGERGVKLSGGQKQRISIARLFLKDPPILILDEATSALDNESERLVQQSLEELMHGRTTLTIAHRLTTIRNASEIIVLTENGIEEQGTHAELIEKNGLYSELYALYSI